MTLKNNRRTLLKQVLAGSAAMAIPSSMQVFGSAPLQSDAVQLKGNINHSVCRWCYDYLSLEELCIAAKKIGLKGIDLVGPADWPVLQKYGLYSSMCNGAQINLVDGWIEKKFHPTLIKNYTEHIDLVSKAGYKNLICFSGNKRGMDEETGLKNMTEGIKQIIGQAEKKGVTIQIEVFNSKVNHPDYMADNTKWTIELCKRIGSPNFKILYDIYHMQISEGDIIHTITDHHQYFGHYHTAGVPGRHEINDSQELHYPAIMKAILATGYSGFVAQEFIPTASDKLGALNEAVLLCDV